MLNLDNAVILRTPRSRLLADKVYDRFSKLVEADKQQTYGKLRVGYPDGIPQQIRGWADQLYFRLVDLVVGGNGGNTYHDIDISRFPVGEVYPQIKATVRRKNVYVIQTFNTKDDGVDPNVPLIELFLINNALKRSSAAEITNIVPFLPYLRQDRGDKSRVPVSAKVVATLLETSGADRIVTFDMHADQEAGFFDIPVDNLSATRLFTEDFKGRIDFAAVAADEGSLKKTRRLAEECGLRVAMIEKKRGTGGVAEVYYVIGEEEVKDKNTVTREDMIDTGGTAIKGDRKLVEKGARDRYLLATHLILSPDPVTGEPTEEKLRRSGLKIVGTDSIPRSDEYMERNRDWLEVRSISPMLAEVIFKIQKGESLTESKMFDIQE